MNDRVASIRLEGNEQRALELIPQGRALLEKAQSVAHRAGVPTFSMSRPLADDAYAYVLIAGSVQIIQISAGVSVPDLVYEEVEDSEPPDFLSGLVFRGIIESRKRTLPNGSVVRYNVAVSFAPTPSCAKRHKLASGPQASKRLAVRPAAMFPEWENRYPVLQFSQYTQPRASMWSGTMKKVVQLVMGYGNGVQVQYDYKFARTHGITKAADGRLWLVEVSITRGVVAMPLPIYPDSDGKAFKKSAAARKDKAMEFVLDELGCLPTGEAFPTGKAYAKAKAAGDIIELATPQAMGDFYWWLSGYSSTCGWAFNDSGTEAHNTGYYYPPDPAVYQMGCWYQINIQIGATNKKRKPGEPLAVGSAKLVKQQEGQLYSPPIFRKPSYIPVKFHEPLLPGLLSHSARPLGPSEKKPQCDTVVFVAFMNGALKTCRYFMNGETKNNSKNTGAPPQPGECDLGNSWEWTTTTGSSSLPAMPYTNDEDPRAVMEEHVVNTTRTSVSLGFDPPYFSDDPVRPEYCGVFRDMMFKNTTVIEERGGEGRGAMFIVPQYSREAYFYAQGHFYNGGRSGSTSVGYQGVSDPNVGTGWRLFGGRPNLGWFDKRDDCGGKHKERKIISTERSGGGACTELADQGGWLGMCQDIESLCSGSPPARKSTYKAWNKGHDFSGDIAFWSHGSNGAIRMGLTENEYLHVMTPSPSPDTGNIQFAYAQHSALGDDCLMYSRATLGERHVRGYVPEPLGEQDGFPAFIGVNQP